MDYHRSAAYREAHTVSLIRRNTFKKVFERAVRFYTHGVTDPVNIVLVRRMLLSIVGGVDVEIGTRIQRARDLLPRVLWYRD